MMPERDEFPHHGRSGHLARHQQSAGGLGVGQEQPDVGVRERCV